MKKTLKWIGIALLVIVVSPLAVLILINLVDEDLDPKAAAYGAPRAARVPETENAYYAMIAMNAGDGADGMAYARAWHNEVKVAANENRKEKLPEAVRAKRPDLCDSRHTACLANIRGKASELTQQLAAYKEDLARYETLLGYQRFEEVIDFQRRSESSLPSYAGWLNAQRAYLLRTSLDLEAGKLEEAVVALEREFAFQRMILSNSRSLLGKMVSAASYWRALQFVNELTDVYADELAPYMRRVSDLLKPLDPPAVSIGNFEMEFGTLRESSLSYSALEKHYGKVPLGRIGYSLFFKRNASLNSSYRFNSGIVPALSASADRVDGEVDAYERKWDPAWDYIYNPVGKILTNIYGVKHYAWRLHDLDALNRLLALHVEMLIAGVGAEQAPAFIARSDARFHNPYTRKPMDWDAEKKRINFPTRSDYIKKLTHGVESGKVFVAVQSSEDDSFVPSVQAPGAKPESLNRARAAVGASKRGRRDEAIRLYGEAIQFDNLSRTNLTLAYRNRGTALRTMDMPDLAIKDFDQALRLNPDDYKAYYDRGQSWRDKKNYDRAIENFTQVLRLKPDDRRAYANRGFAWSSKREYQRAIDDYTLALQHDPKYASTYVSRGNAWSGKGEPDRAIEDYTQALRLDPQDIWAYISRGNVWSDKRDYERAIEDYTQALQLDQKYNAYFAYSYRGNAWSAKGEYERAIEDYTQELQRYPTEPFIYYPRGVAQFLAGRSGLAAEDFDRALALAPANHSFVLWEFLALRRGDGNAAQALAKRAVKLDLTQWPGPVVRLFQGKMAPNDMLARAASRDTQEARERRLEGMFFLGHWHLMRGERDHAVRAFREARALATATGDRLSIEFNAARVELLAMGERVN